MSKTALIAVGGNSLIRAGQRGTLEEQYENALATARAIAKMIKDGWEVVITHGNGPQAGAALIRSERGSNEVYTHTLDMCVATTQSEIGYILQRAFIQAFNEIGLEREVLTIPTMVIVEPSDPAFKKPSKPIGPFYTREIAMSKKEDFGWDVVEDAARGWRRVVASPEPIQIVELDIIKKVINMDIIAIALGGGGIPVIRQSDGTLIGIEAVIDKDRSSALLANGLNVDLFIISTDADKVYLNFKKSNQQGLDIVNLAELENYYNEEHFPPGNMGPKVEAVMRYLKNGGKKAIITTFNHIPDALEGRAGTTIFPNKEK